MDGGYILLITITATALLLMIQRAEPKRRRLVATFVAMGLLLIRHNAFLKADLHEETAIAFGLSLAINGLFWLFVGRYNPVDADSEIEVVGLND